MISKHKGAYSKRDRFQVEILETFNLLSERSNKFFQSYELTPQQFNVLSILFHGGPLSTSDILDWMIEKNAGVSRLVDRLVKKDLVSKVIDPADKRLVRIALTEKGVSLFRQVDEDYKALDDPMINLSDDEVEQLLQLLIKLKGY
jgi:DNA-binding MarR family transcriptional regulator